MQILATAQRGHYSVVTIPVHQHFDEILRARSSGTEHHVPNALTLPSLPHAGHYGPNGLFIQSETSVELRHLQGVGVALALFRSLPGLLRDAVDQVAKPAGDRRGLEETRTLQRGREMVPRRAPRVAAGATNKAIWLGQTTAETLCRQKMSSLLYPVMIVHRNKFTVHRVYQIRSFITN